MTTQDMQYLDSYKRLEQFCSDAVQSAPGQSGVKTYEELLRSRLASCSDRRRAEAFLNRLTELRRLRNALVHDPNPPFCREQDFSDLEEIYQSFLNLKDPLSVLEREKAERLKAAKAAAEAQKARAQRNEDAERKASAPIPSKKKKGPREQDRSISMLVILFFLMLGAFLVILCLYLRYTSL